MIVATHNFKWTLPRFRDLVCRLQRHSFVARLPRHSAWHFATAWWRALLHGHVIVYLGGFKSCTVMAVQIPSKTSRSVIYHVAAATSNTLTKINGVRSLKLIEKWLDLSLTWIGSPRHTRMLLNAQENPFPASPSLSCSSSCEVESFSFPP